MDDQRDTRQIQVSLRLPAWLQTELWSRVPKGDRNAWMIAAVEEKLEREDNTESPPEHEPER